MNIINKLSIFTLISIFFLQIGCANIDSLIKKRKYNKAAQFCEDLNSKQDSERCWLKLADALKLEGNDTDAEKYYNKAGDPVKIYTEQAEKSFATQNLDEAVKYFAKADNMNGINKVAKAFFLKGKYQKAADLYLETNNKIQLKLCSEKLIEEKKYNIASKYIKTLNNNNLKIIIANYYITEGKFNEAKILLKKIKNKKIRKKLKFFITFKNELDKYNKIALTNPKKSRRALRKFKRKAKRLVRRSRKIIGKTIIDLQSSYDYIKTSCNNDKISLAALQSISGLFGR
jgi:hypothetical protein